MPKTTQVLKTSLLKHSQYLLHGSETIFLPKSRGKTYQTKVTPENNVTITANKTEEPWHAFCDGCEGIFAGNWGQFTIILEYWRSPCPLCFCMQSLVDCRRLNVQGTPMKFTVHGTYSHQTIENQLISNHWHANCSVEVGTGSFGWLLPSFCGHAVCQKRFKRCNRRWCRIATSTVPARRTDSSEEVHLWRCKNDSRSWCSTLIRPLEYLETDRKKIPTTIWLPLGSVLSGPLPSTSDQFTICSEPVIRRHTGSKLADQLRSWSQTEPTNKSTRTPQPTREHRRSSRKPYTTMDPDITLVCFGLIFEVVYRKCIFWH